MAHAGEVLKNLIEEDYGIVQETERWWRADKHNSLVLDYEKGVFYWNSADIAGGVPEYYKEVRGIAPPEIFVTRPSFSVDIGFTPKDEVVVYPKLVDAFWQLGTKHREYWHKRLLTDKTIDRFKLGYNNEWYAIPVYKDGDFYNIQFRRDEPEKRITQKYKRPPFLFNSGILGAVSEVIFAEGIVDAILLSQYGFPAISKNTGANGWYPEWIKYFTQIDKIYFLFDNDSAGRKGMLRGTEIFGPERCVGYTFKDFDKQGYDVIDFFRDGNTKEDLTDLLGMARMIY